MLRRVRAGDLVWRTKDPALEARLRHSWDGRAAAEARRLPVTAVRGGGGGGGEQGAGEQGGSGRQGGRGPGWRCGSAAV